MAVATLRAAASGAGLIAAKSLHPYSVFSSLGTLTGRIGEGPNHLRHKPEISKHKCTTGGLTGPLTRRRFIRTGTERSYVH